VLDGAQQTLQRVFDVENLILNSHNALLELAADALRTEIALNLGCDRRKLGQIVGVERLVFVLDLNIVVARTLVYCLNMHVFVRVDLIFYGEVVAVARLLANVFVDLGVAREH